MWRGLCRSSPKRRSRRRRRLSLGERVKSVRSGSRMSEDRARNEREAKDAARKAKGENFQGGERSHFRSGISGRGARGLSRSGRGRRRGGSSTRRVRVSGEKGRLRGTLLRNVRVSGERGRRRLRAGL